MNEISKRVPVIPLQGIVCMPDMPLTVELTREKTIAAASQAAKSDQLVFLVAQRDPQTDDPGESELFRKGVLANVRKAAKNQADKLVLTVYSGLAAELQRVVKTEPYIEADVIITGQKDSVSGRNEVEAMRMELESIIDDYEALGSIFNEDIHRALDAYPCNIVSLVHRLCASLPIRWQDKQKLLEAADFSERYISLLHIMRRDYEVISITRDIQLKVKARLEKNQREYVLREQLKEIKEELGDDVQTEAEEYLEKLKTFDAPDIVKEKLEKDIQRFQTMNWNGAESSVYRNYIDTVFEMPWSKLGKDNEDLKKAEEILRKDHYGLDKVKERIMEYLAVRKLSHKESGSILCLVGPPGTGKTSIAKSIARALDKKYVRISLGGVHDEAEIRGHRKTYIGAMPGRIATALKQAEVRNPVLLLDEIDKVGVDNRGDTFSALLEVLDSEQNMNFRDNYLELPLDLSEVLFITTANNLYTIPQPLLDRMEVIEINTYTQNEKFHIAKEHLIGKQLKANGLKSREMVITDKALSDIIIYYTREAGVRNLERRIGELCRKTARELLQENSKSVRISKRNLEKYLGKKKYNINPANTDNEVGTVRGLAWTSVGGDTLSIEVNIMPGKGNTQLTGQLGDVMKESAMAGISYIRSVSDEYGIDRSFFEGHDIHIHIPEGAVPKDGPSAGVTMVTAMLSAITEIPVRADVAMTGEVTLRGRVLPIGGLREKTIAAKIAGIKTVIVPEENRNDIAELNEEITQGMEFVYAKSMEDILPVAFEYMPKTFGLSAEN